MERYLRELACFSPCLLFARPRACVYVCVWEMLAAVLGWTGNEMTCCFYSKEITDAWLPSPSARVLCERVLLGGLSANQMMNSPALTGVSVT